MARAHAAHHRLRAVHPTLAADQLRLRLAGRRASAHDVGYEAAVDQWEHDHARPLLATTLPADVRAAVAEAKQAIADLSYGRPEAASRVLDELGRWAATLGLRCGPTVAAGPG